MLRDGTESLVTRSCPFLCHAAGPGVVIFLVNKPVHPGGRSVQVMALEVDSLEPGQFTPILISLLPALDQDLPPMTVGLPPAFVNKKFYWNSHRIHSPILSARIK